MSKITSTIQSQVLLRLLPLADAELLEADAAVVVVVLVVLAVLDVVEVVVAGALVVVVLVVVVAATTCRVAETPTLPPPQRTPML
jgi:hypothetical protein